MKYIYLLLFSISSIFLSAQNTVSTFVVDYETKVSIPYCSITYSDRDGIFTNEDGSFKISRDTQGEIKISYMAYHVIITDVTSLSKTDTIFLLSYTDSKRGKKTIAPNKNIKSRKFIIEENGLRHSYIMRKDMDLILVIDSMN